MFTPKLTTTRRQFLGAFGLLGLTCVAGKAHAAVAPTTSGRLLIENNASQAIMLDTLSLRVSSGQDQVLRLRSKHLQPGQKLSVGIASVLGDELIEAAVMLSTSDGTQVARFALTDPRRDGEQVLSITDEHLPTPRPDAA